MRADYPSIVSGLDQLFFSPLVEDETPQERSDCIEVFLKFNGWTWDEYLEELSKEKPAWTPPLSSMS